MVKVLVSIADSIRSGKFECTLCLSFRTGVT